MPKSPYSIDGKPLLRLYTSHPFKGGILKPENHLGCRLLQLHLLPDSPISLFHEGAMDTVILWHFSYDVREMLTLAKAYFYFSLTQIPFRLTLSHPCASFPTPTWVLIHLTSKLLIFLLFTLTLIS